MNFKKIKFNAKDKTLEISYSEYNGQSSDDIVNKCGQVVHGDFIDAINALKYHYAYLCDLREVAAIDEREERIEMLCEHTALKEIAVASVVFTSIGEDEAVMICGNKRFAGKYININTPLTPLNADGYIYYWELGKALETLQEETRLYLCEQKWGVKQTALDFGMDAEFAKEQTFVAEVNESLAESLLNVAAPVAKRGRRPKVQSDNQSSVN